MQTSLLYHITGVNGYRPDRPRISKRNGKTREIANDKLQSECKKANRSEAKLAMRGKAGRQRLLIPVHRIDDNLRCPHCGAKEIKAYETKPRLIQTTPWGRLQTFLDVKVRRFYCHCCHKTHFEHIPFLTGPKSRMTRQLERTIVELRADMSISATARYFGITWESVKDAEKRALAIKHRCAPLAGVTGIGIDELYVFSHEKSKRKYITVVRDLKTGAVLSVTRGKGEDALKMLAYRMRRWKPKITYVCMDMANAYENFVAHNLPGAMVVFDHFHVIKAMNDRMDKVRRRACASIRASANKTLANETSSERDRRLAKASLERVKKAKGSRFAALRNAEDVKKDEKARRNLENLLALDEEFAKCHALKEDLRAIYSQAKTASDAATLFLDWIDKARASKVREMKSMADTVEDHLEGILGYWVCRSATNAATEGFNNKIRWLIKQAYGYRDYKYFRLKIFDLPNIRTDNSDF